MVDRIYPTELQLNRANSSDTEAPFLVLNLCIFNGTVSTKIYVKWDDLDFDIVNFSFLDGDVPRRTSHGVYISQLIRFARASSNLNDFNYRNKAITAKLHRQGYRYFKLLKAFSKFYRRHNALLERYSVSLKTLLQQGISEPEFYGDLVYIFRKIVGKSNFSEQFRKFINRYKRIGYSLDIMRQTACLIVNPIIKSLISTQHALVYTNAYNNHCQCLFTGWIVISKRLATGFGKIMLRLSDMTENALY